MAVLVALVAYTAAVEAEVLVRTELNQAPAALVLTVL
jgi:hypothetical protein